MEGTATRDSWRKRGLELKGAGEGKGAVFGSPTLPRRAVSLLEDHFKDKAPSLCWQRAQVIELPTNSLKADQL
jgi:hypothetical protein